jgi:hypothetical protein
MYFLYYWQFCVRNKIYAYFWHNSITNNNDNVYFLCRTTSHYALSAHLPWKGSPLQHNLIFLGIMQCVFCSWFHSTLSFFHTIRYPLSLSMLWNIGFVSTHQQPHVTKRLLTATASVLRSFKLPGFESCVITGHICSSTSFATKMF